MARTSLKSPKLVSKTWNKPLWSKSPLHSKRRRTVESQLRQGRNLPAIREDTLSPVQRRTKPDYRNFGPDEDTYHGGVEEQDEASDSNNNYKNSFFHWEEESTLFSDLLDEGLEPDGDHNLDRLADSLQQSFDIGGKQLKREIAETLVPTVNHVKALYGVLNDKDMSFGKGIITFNNACKESEVIAIQEQDEYNNLRAAMHIEDLFAQLKDAYARREKLWSKFQKDLDAAAEPSLEALQKLPGKVENTITKLEKHARSLEKDDDISASATEKKLKGILSKIT